jgi:hypothetical protein
MGEEGMKFGTENSLGVVDAHVMSSGPEGPLQSAGDRLRGAVASAQIWQK